MTKPLDFLNRLGATVIGDSSLFDKLLSETRLDRLSEILPYRIYDEEDDLYINANSCGWILEVVPLLGADDTIVSVLSELLADTVPENANLQIINWSSPHISPIINRWVSARTNLSPILKRLVNYRVKHFQTSGSSSLSAHTPLFTRQFRVFISLGLPGEATSKTRKILKTLKVDFEQAFKNLSVATRNITPQPLIRFLDEILNPASRFSRTPIIYDESQLIDRQIIRNDTIAEIESSRILLETASLDEDIKSNSVDGQSKSMTQKFDLRTFSAFRFPDRFHQSQMTNAIGHLMSDQLRLPCPVLKCLSLSFPSKEKGEELANAKFGRAEQQSGTNLSRFLPELNQKAEDWKWVRERIRDGQRLVKAGYFVVTIAPEDKGEVAERGIRSIYRSLGWELNQDRFVCAQTLAACVPLSTADGLGDDLLKLRRLRHMVTDTAIQIAPLQGEYLGVEQADLLLIGRRGTPFFWSPYSNQSEGNHNVAIIGSSGSGKSVLMQELVAGLLGSGTAIAIIDDGESFKHTCEALGGKHINFTLENKISLNPFSMVDGDLMETDPDYKSDNHNLICMMIAQMAKLNERLSQCERGIIDKTVNEVWKNYGTKASIDHVARGFKEEGEDGKKLALSLTKFTSLGSYHRYFKPSGALDIKDDLTVFELSKLHDRDELKSVVLLALVFLINQRMVQDRSERMALVIDEAWSLLGEGSTGEFISGFARRCRKYGGSLITATQGLDDYYKSEGSRAAFENSDHVISLRLKPEAVSQIVKNERLRLSEHDADMIRSLSISSGEYSELYLMGPYGNHVGRLVLDRFSKTLYSSDARTFKQIEQLQSKGVCIEEAIETIMNLYHFSGATSNAH